MRSQCNEHLEPGLNFLGQALGAAMFDFSDDDSPILSADESKSADVQMIAAKELKIPK